jgi:hypothetical protein
MFNQVVEVKWLMSSPKKNRSGESSLIHGGNNFAKLYNTELGT